jgi:hypothetical protein
MARRAEVKRYKQTKVLNGKQSAGVPSTYLDVSQRSVDLLHCCLEFEGTDASRSGGYDLLMFMHGSVKSVQQADQSMKER